MKVKIRKGVFETNSSSTHSMTICTKKEWSDWIDGLVYFDTDMHRFEPAIPANKDFDKLTYDEFMFDNRLNTFMKSHTTESGDEIVIFGEYGYDG